MFIAPAGCAPFPSAWPDLLLRLYARLRSNAGGDGATRRAERSHQQRLERQEPQFDRSDDAEDVAIAPPPTTRSAEPRATGAPLVAKPAKAKTSRKATESQATLDLVPDERYDLPPLDLLDKVPSNAAVQKINDDSLQKNARLLESVLEDFGVKGEIVQVRPGPVVTLYELEPAPGTKTSRVVGLADDVARSMSAVSVRIAVVPGRSVIGIELPNRVRETVYLRELLESEAFERTAAKLALVFGKDIGGAPDHRRSRAHAASADRRHHRLRQVGRHQHDDPVADLPAVARRLQVHHDRPEDAGAVDV